MPLKKFKEEWEHEMWHQKPVLLRLPFIPEH